MAEQLPVMQEESETCSCVRCSLELPKEEMEAHICSEHLEYFPYSCAHCGHYFTTDVLAHFHANIKEHLPMKIREQPIVKKFQELRGVMANSFQDAAAADRVLKGALTRPPPPVNTTARKEKEQGAPARKEPQPRQTRNSQGLLDFPQWTVMAVMDAERVTPHRAASNAGSSGSGQTRKRKNTSNPMPGEALCRLCKVLVGKEVQIDHVLTHRCGPAPFACLFCSFLGNSVQSVRSHVQIKHTTCRPATKGVKQVEKDKSELSPEELIRLCFGPQTPEQEATPEEPAQKAIKDGVEESEGVGTKPKYTREVTLPNGKVYRMMECRKCGDEVCEAEASIHVFQKHIGWKDMICCSYCQFQSTHDWAAVKEHMAEAHPGEKMVIRDKRKGIKARLLMKQWIRVCFTDKVEAILKIEMQKKNDEQRERKAKKAATTAPETPTEDYDEPPIEIRVCYQCSSWVGVKELDQHVWRIHCSDNLPYKCGACKEGAESLEGLEEHWMSAHGQMTMEVVPNDGAQTRFDELMVACFPAEAAMRWADIKTEPQDSYEC